MSNHQKRNRRYRDALRLIPLMLLVSIANLSSADQNDPRLDVLFTELREAENPAQAKRAEREIWSIWHESPDTQAEEIMRSARAALDANDFPGAINYLNSLVDHVPNFAEAWNQRAIVLFLADDFPGALRDIQQTLNLEPRHFGALSGRGQIYLHLDEPDLAAQAFQSALESNPWMDNVRNQLAMVRALINARPKPI